MAESGNIDWATACRARPAQPGSFKAVQRLSTRPIPPMHSRLTLSVISTLMPTWPGRVDELWRVWHAVIAGAREIARILHGDCVSCGLGITYLEASVCRPKGKQVGIGRLPRLPRAQPRAYPRVEDFTRQQPIDSEVGSADPRPITNRTYASKSTGKRPTDILQPGEPTLERTCWPWPSDFMRLIDTCQGPVSSMGPGSGIQSAELTARADPVEG